MEVKPLNPAFPVQRQFGENAAGPVALVNVFWLEAADEDAFLKAWEADAGFMKSRAGFISTQLHRAVGPSPCYFNYAIWETIDAFRAAFSDPSFQARLGEYPSSAATAPHLFKRVAVPGICVA